MTPFVRMGAESNLAEYQAMGEEKLEKNPESDAHVEEHERLFAERLFENDLTVEAPVLLTELAEASEQNFILSTLAKEKAELELVKNCFLTTTCLTPLQPAPLERETFAA